MQRRVTVGELLEDYLRDLRLRGKKGAKQEEFRLRAKSPLRSALGHLRASEVTRPVLVGYAERRLAKGLANATVNRDLEAMRSAFRLGKKSGRVMRVPEFPEKLAARVRTGFFDAEELGRLCEAAPAWLAEMARFAFATGWRRGELLGLKWEWVDWDEREIRLPDTKNGEGRVVPIAGELVKLMERLHESRTVEKSDGSTVLSEWVFHVEGSQISLKRYRRAWATVRKAARLEGRLFHDFRRTGARRLINSGVSQAVAMKVTGHKTPSLFRRYQIVEKDDVAAAREKVAAREERPRGARLAMFNGHPDRHP